MKSEPSAFLYSSGLDQLEGQCADVDKAVNICEPNLTRSRRMPHSPPDLPSWEERFKSLQAALAQSGLTITESPFQLLDSSHTATRAFVMKPKPDESGPNLPNPSDPGPSGDEPTIGSQR
jgi:hypothetical protein